MSASGWPRSRCRCGSGSATRSCRGTRPERSSSAISATSCWVASAKGDMKREGQRDPAPSTSRMLEAAMRYARAGVIVSERTGDDASSYHIVYANPAMGELTGYSVAELIGKRPELFHGPTSDLVAVHSAVRNIARGQPATFETPVKRKDGKTILLEVHLTPIQDPTRSTPLLLGIHHEISGRKAEEARFRALIRHASDVVAIVAEQGAVLYVSPSVEAILGRTPEEMEGTQFVSYVHPDDLAVATQQFAAVIVE